jgi:hypothetical protein
MVTKKELNVIFKKHGLNLGFPYGQRNGGTVTDWSLWYSNKDYNDSDLCRFKNIIKNYYPQYILFNCGTGASIGIKRA